jgi:hypothetical protein
MRMRLGDIVPAELQNAPDYSASAPLFLYSLNDSLTGDASYYNPTQASQSQSGGAVSAVVNAPPSYYDAEDPNASILPATGGNGMTADQETCQQIQCGAITQEQAGVALLQACSAAGYVGARTCNDPVCVPFNLCPPAAAASAPSGTPGPAASTVPMPSATTAVMPSITNTAQVVAPMQVITPSGMQQRMPQIVNPAPAVMPGPACDNSFASWVNDNPLLAIGALAALAYVCMGKKGR